MQAVANGADLKAMQNLFEKLFDKGCPTYTCHDGSRTRDGLVFCFYCDEEIDKPHADDCVWWDIVIHGAPIPPSGCEG